jgi:type IV pilus assembly protein PilM
MLKSKSFLAVDFGAGSLKLAEFEVNEAGGLRLKQYGIKSLGAEGAQESTREATILKALQEMLAELSLKARNINVCAPGFHVFSKFVKLPPVDASKVTQIIQYEAQQNVPFPLQEVVWDYQIMGSTAGGELEVLLVAIKADIVEGLFRVTDASKLRLEVADVSPAALCNAFRYNYGDLEDCTMLLDIGAKTSNLLFFEKGKVYSRSINLGANSITQDFANEAKLKFDVAERTKIAEGFVSLGGAYEEPENPHQAAISKIARQFMTRLHIQVNQTMQFYRGQQGGSAPQRLFLSGGASIMPYTAQFFAEKLNVPVEYFNPFRNVQIDPAVNLEELARVAHSLGEVVGLGLRNLAHCPVELNLIPETTRRWQNFNEKKPYLIATVFSLVAVVAAMGLLFQKLAAVKADELNNNVTPRLAPLQQKAAQFRAAFGQLKAAQQELDQVTTWMEARDFWANVLVQLRLALIRSERISQQKLHTDTGIWVEQFLTMTPRSEVTTLPSGPGPAPAPTPAFAPEVDEPGNLGYNANLPPGAPSAPAAPTPEPTQTPSITSATPTVPEEIWYITLRLRSVNLQGIQGVDPAANSTIYYTTETELKDCPLFDTKGTQLQPQIVNDESTGTFAFGIVVQLKRPMKL